MVVAYVAGRLLGPERRLLSGEGAECYVLLGGDAS